MTSHRSRLAPLVSLLALTTVFVALNDVPITYARSSQTSLREYRDPRTGLRVSVPRTVPSIVSERPFSDVPPDRTGLGPITPMHGDGLTPFRSGSYPERTLDELREHYARDWSAITVLPTSQSYDRGEIAVIEDDGTILLPSGANVVIDPASLARRFLELHDDEYDYINVWSASNMTNLTLGGGFAYELNVRNEVQGLGLSIFDFSEDFGSGGTLKSFLNMNRLSAYPAGPNTTFLGTNTAMDVLGQEAGHRFAAFTFFDNGGSASNALLGRDDAHWSFFFNSLASDMEGNQWRDNQNGTFTSVAATNGYAFIDEYLYGLRDSSEVDTLWYIENPTNFNPPGTYLPRTGPSIGITCSGTKRMVDISQITVLNGLRSPGIATSQKTFRMAWVLLIRNGDVPTPADLAKIDLFRTTWEPYFQTAVNNLGAMDTHLNSVAGSVVIEHVPLKDTENTLASRPVTAAMYVKQRSLLIGFNASSPRVFYRTNGGAYSPLVMAPLGGNQYQASIPAQPLGTIVDYYLTAASDSAGIDAELPAGAPGTKFTYVVGPDDTEPALAHTPPPDPAASQLPVTVTVDAFDNLGLDSVSVSWRINDGPIQTARVAATAGDGPYSFDIGAGAVFGDVVTYRLGAVDLAASKNRALLPDGGAPFALMVGNNFAEDFENSDGGFTHTFLTPEFFDSWHLSTQRNHTPGGGSSWKCGDEGPASYSPNLDAGLVAGPILVGAGGTLAFHHFFDIESSDLPGQAYDGARVDISTNNGASWSPITPAGGYPATIISNPDSPYPAGTPVWSGTSGAFVPASFDLSAFNGQTVWVRFRLGSDSFVGGEGWYVDDVTVTNVGGEPVPVPVVPASFALDPAFPNPTAGRTTIAFRLPAASTVALEIYDVRGARVRSLLAGAMPAGPHAVDWDGLGEDGSRVPPGLYFYRLTADRFGARAGRLVVTN
ncbi:MAG: FlgD immunoglobulin-like domain containing protein [Candidatus Eiseniibacteriota bacterium]